MRQNGWIANHRLVSFFILAFLISWPLFLIAGATKVAWVTVVGLFGPAAAAVIVAGISHGRVGTGQLLGRFLIWRISPLWFGFALLFPAASYGISSYVSPASSGAPTYSPSRQ